MNFSKDEFLKRNRIMRYPLFLARKLSLSSGGRRSSPAVRVAVTAVALSVGVMIAAIAIVLGFKREIREKVIGFNSHITLYAVPDSEEGSNLITLTPTLRNVLDEAGFINGYSLEASIPAILKTTDNFKGVYLKSAQSRHTLDFLRSNAEEGAVPNFSKPGNDLKIAVSRIAADQLALKAGDKIDTYFMTGDIRVRRLEIAAVFNSHFDSYDDIYIYGPLPLIQQLGEISATQGTSIAVTVDNFRNVEEYSAELQHRLDEATASGLLYRQYRVDNARSQGAGFFHWLALLDTNVAVVLVLMTFVACITLISGMLIIILDKKNFIGLLRSLGASVKGVRRVFILMAVRIAIAGLLIGNIATLCFLAAQQHWHFLRLDPDSYYIDFVPVELDWTAFAILDIATVAIVYLCLILPSWFAARISPAETMRYE